MQSFLRLVAPRAGAVVLCLPLLAGCGTATPTPRAAVPARPVSASALPVAAAAATPPWPVAHPLPGMPAVLDDDVYTATRAGQVRSDVARDPAYLYVPNSLGAGITTVIDQRTRKVVKVLHTGKLSQHVTPSYDLRTLYVESSLGHEIVAVDPRTATVLRRYPVQRPYNLYFTPDGRHGVVMDEQHQKLLFTDPHDFRVQKELRDPSCSGPNHADFSANGRFFVVTCEFSHSLIKVRTTTEEVVGRLDLGATAKPQDVRLAPDGRSFFVADMDDDRLVAVDARTFRIARTWQLPAMSMPHGIYPSRDGRLLYVSDRMAGAVSVFSLGKRRFVARWPIPGGGTPDMGGVSADGRTLWLSGRYTGEVYGFDTRTGKLVARIHVGGSPHGMLVWPQPGRYSLGHTGNLR